MGRDARRVPATRSNAMRNIPVWGKVALALAAAAIITLAVAAGGYLGIRRSEDALTTMCTALAWMISKNSRRLASSCGGASMSVSA